MFQNITTQGGSNKPTPRIILALLGAILPIVWGLKDQLLADFHLPPEQTSLVASSLTIILIFVADKFGVKLPSGDTPIDKKQDDSTPKTS